MRGLVRPGRAGSLPRGVEAAEASGLDDRSALRAALRGVDAAVHLAARVHVMRDTSLDPLAEFRRVNVEGTRALLEEAVAAGVGRFVLASSVKAMGEGGAAVLTEETPAEPVDAYGVSKLEAEVVAGGFAERIHVASARFPLVYGPGVKGNMLRLFQLVDRGIPLPLGAVRNRRSLLFVGNASAAIDALLTSTYPSGEVFLVSDGRDLSTPEVVEEIARALGRPPRLLPFPVGPARLAARVGDAIDRIAPFPLTSRALHRLLGSLYVDSSRLARFTGFEPPFTVQEGLAETARWYRGEGSGA